MSIRIAQESFFSVNLPRGKNLQPIASKNYENSAVLRFFLKGNQELYLAYFQKAFDDDNYVLQIALALAYGTTTEEKSWGRTLKQQPNIATKEVCDDINEWFKIIYKKSAASVKFSDALLEEFCKTAIERAIDAEFIEMIFYKNAHF